MENTTFRANDFAPRDGTLSVYFKRITEKLSDGFAAVFDGEIYLIDVGTTVDKGMLLFLTELREKWLANAPQEADTENARLEIHVIISHPHPDHVGALPFLLSDPRICVVELIAPKRCYRSLPGPDLLPNLEVFEERLYGPLHLLSEYHHKTTKVKNLPYGKIYPIRPEGTDVALTVFPLPLIGVRMRRNTVI